VGMTDAIDLTKEQRITLSDLLRRFLPGVAVWAYGSRVKWTARPNSDLDLVAFTTSAQRPQVAELKDALAESNLPFPVDLHVWDEVPERFREIIQKEFVVVQESKQLESSSGGLGMAGESPIEYDLRWPVVALSEIAVKIGSGATPKGGADAYLPSRARFALVRSQNVFDRRFDYNGLAFISDEQADGLRGVILQPNDILLNITGDGITFGRACIVPKDVLPACVNQHVSIIRLDLRRADAGYVLAFLTHPDVKSYIESFNAGGSRRAVTKGHIESFRLPLPPLPEQRAIAHILGTLDDKIELNRRMNETLEAMARALFKSWFVDFDPVRAKAEGRSHGLPKHLADLFPDSFVNSELGEIPRGWEVKRLSDLCVLGRGASPRPINDYMNGEVPWVKIADATAAGGPFLFETKEKLKIAGMDKSVTVSPGGLILSNSATCGVPVFVELHGCIHDGWLYFKNLHAISKLYLFHVLIELGEHLVHIADGSVQKNLNTELVGGQHVLVPPQAVVEAFDQPVTTWFMMMRANGIGSRTLGALRDTLLPELVSGGMRVKDTQKV
jgi:type I restriction enzyme, S subunit